jgi:hypothetical protein
MMPTFKPEGLKKPKPWEYALRFAFGGLIAVAAHLIAEAYGPRVGGLFLAFPAIVPASLTLMKEHDGRRATVEDAKGSCLGSLAMISFAAFVLLAVEAPPPLALGGALVLWAMVAVGTWLLVFGRR